MATQNPDLRIAWRTVLRKTDMPASGFRIGLSLVDRFRNGSTGLCYPSLEKLADDCAMSRRTARDGVAALKARGLIKTKKRGLTGSLEFELTIPAVTFIEEASDVNPSLANGPSDGFPAQQVEYTKGRISADQVTDFRQPSDVKPSSNLTLEHEIELEKDESSSCGTTSVGYAVSAHAPTLDVFSFASDISAEVSYQRPTKPADAIAVDKNARDTAFLPANEEEARRLIVAQCADRSRIGWALRFYAEGRLTHKMFKELAA